MSDYEKHKGKIIKIEPLEGETFESQCKRIAFENGCKDDLYYEGWIFDEFYKKYLRFNNELYEVLEHEELDYSDSYISLNANVDGSISFETMFYNGGTCMSEMIRSGLKKLIKPL